MTERGRVEPGYEAVLRLVGARTGLVFAPNRHDDALASIRRGMTKAEIGDVGQYLALLERDASALDELIAELTVGETYFFREMAHFEFIRREVIPEWLRRSGPQDVLRVWSAGCASGEEAYSLAIVLDEAGLLSRARVVGSDISRPALARAEAATYGPWSLRGVTESVLQRYFSPVAGRNALDERIRKAVSFHYLNLAEDVYPSLTSGTDLILCRNVLIYFDRETVRRVAERLLRCLAPGGWLIAGPSDPLLSELARFETVTKSHGLVYRRAPDGWHSLRSEPSLPREQPEGPAAPTLARDPPGADHDAGHEGSTWGPPAPVAAPVAPEAPPERARVEAGAADAANAVRACANRHGAGVAVELVETALRRYSLSPELHFLHAVLLLELGRLDAATAALRRVLYLDSSLAMAHFVLGTLSYRRGDRPAARRAFETAAALAEAGAPEAPVPLGEGEPAGRLALAARTQANLLREERVS